MPPWIEITVALPCPVRCSYCPQSVIERVYDGTDTLSLDNFKKILTNIPKEIIINFAGFCEPFYNPECSAMIKFAYESGYRVHINTTMIGFTETDAELLKDIKFVDFVGHDIGQPKPDRGFTINWAAVPNPTTRAGNLSPVSESPWITGCSRSSWYTTNVMLPNGDVVLCCCDWAAEYILGNLLVTNYDDLVRTGGYPLCKKCNYGI